MMKEKILSIVICACMFSVLFCTLAFASASTQEVVFDGRNGVSQSVALSDNIAMPNTNLVWGDNENKDNYIFAGWYTGIDGTGEKVENLNNLTQATTLYAKWNNAYGNTVRTEGLNVETLATTNNLAQSWSWDKASRTLILNNVTFNGYSIIKDTEVHSEIYENSYTIYAENDLNIVLKGSNTVININPENIDFSLGVYVVYSSMGTSILNISGQGSLLAMSDTAPMDSNAIGGESDVNIKDATIVAQSGKNTKLAATGIGSTDGDITITNSNVTTIGADSVSDSYGFYCGNGNIKIINSKVNATSGDGGDVNTIGIYAYDNIDIINSTVLAKTENGAHTDSFAIFGDNITINKSDVTVMAGDTTDNSVGIYATGSLIISDNSKATISGHLESLLAWNNLCIGNGSIKASTNHDATTLQDGLSTEITKTYGNNTFSFKTICIGDNAVENIAKVVNITTQADKFSDVSADAWYYNVVNQAVDNGLLKGTADMQFSPNMSTTRGMIATVLWRMENEPVVNYAMSFKDVDENAYYAEAVRWAQANKIINGYSEEIFAPESNIIREDLACILYKYAQFKGQGFVGDWMYNLALADKNEISEYAYEPICWVNMHNIMSGKGNNNFAPKDMATRAEVASILSRFAENIK